MCVDEGYQGVSALECSCSSHTVLKLFSKLKLKGKKGMRDFPGCLVVKTLHFLSRGTNLIPDWGTINKILHATQHDQKRKLIINKLINK